MKNFYAELPARENFLHAVDLANFVAIPSTWYIVVTDIADSTVAIESGRYKEVNLLGVCSIAAVLNVAQNIELPYVFGGDGATMLIPVDLLEVIKPPLRALQELAQTQFGMQLRVGTVPVETVVAAGHTVKIAKLKLTDSYSQALFTGGGLNYATDLVKAPATAGLYQIDGHKIPKADLTGLECRWQDIPSRWGETVSLLVLAMMHNDIQNNAVYQAVISEIHHIYGNEDAYHPIATNYLNLVFDSQRLNLEAKVKTSPANRFARWLYLSQIQAENILGAILMGFGVQTGDTDWKIYKAIVQATSDYKKFDDMLRMIIAGTHQQRLQLLSFLEQKRQAGDLVYGLHVSDRALMTCLVYERNGRQMHFIDGADGGYALAAKELKQQIKPKAANWRAYTHLIEKRNSIKSPAKKIGNRSSQMHKL